MAQRTKNSRGKSSRVSTAKRRKRKAKKVKQA